MRYLTIICMALVACKNSGQNTSSAKTEKLHPTVSNVKEIIVDANRRGGSKPDFQVVEMTCKADVLQVVFRYSGGCKEHDFNAYFSGAWAKSLPPKASLQFEHLDPENDPCRSLIKDTFLFNLKPLQYPGGSSVTVNWADDPSIQATYSYGK